MTLRVRQIVQTVAILAAVVVVFAAMFKLLFDNSYHVLNAAVRARSQAYATSIASHVDFALAARDVDEAKGLLRAFLKQHPEAQAVAVLDSQGRLFAHSGDLSALLPVLHRHLKSVPETRLEGEAVTAVTPVRPDGELSGYVAYAESLTELLAYRRQVWRLAAISAAALILLIPIVASFAFRRLVRGLTRLSVATKRARAGDLRARVTVEGKDELASLSRQFNEMLGEIDGSRRRQGEQERMRRELELAESIQTSLLPDLTPVNGLTMAARMLPATEVGGDYYDVLRHGERRCWIAIGDVAGHGLTAGLVMMMAQSSIATATAREPEAKPSRILSLVNQVVHANVRGRWGASHHMTLTLLRYCGDGDFRYAGAHEDLVLWRRGEGVCELRPTTGTWIGAIPDVSKVMPDSEVHLDPGDRLILFTDGVTEAIRADGKLFGVDRLCQAIDSGGDTPQAVVDRVLEEVQRFTPRRNDDQTVLVIERGNT